nr:MAG TPA: hypothetical protein [Caudoviricetes sp.]
MPCTWCIPNTTLPFYTISVCVQDPHLGTT